MTFAARCGAAGAERADAMRALTARIRDHGIEQLRVVWCDLHGTLRGKTLVVGDGSGSDDWLASTLDAGIGMVSTLLLKDTADRTAYPVFDPGAMAGLPGFGAANNVQLLADPASFVALPWAPRCAWLRAAPHWDDGTPVAVDPRRALQRALAALADAGLSLVCGLEVEFHVWRITHDNDAVDAAAWPAPAPTLAHVHPGYQLLGDALADRSAAVLDTVRRTALGLGLPLRSLEIELGPSQFEAVFAAGDALAVADQMVWLRNGVRQALRREGYLASFVCRPPLPQSIASGWHLHQSLRDATGAPAFVHNAPQHAAAGASGPSAADVLSPTGCHWLGGLLAHAGAITALSAPAVSSYGRLGGSPMAPRSAVWARDHRGAMLRVVGAPGDAATRIENRVGEPMANPHLAIAAQAIAGLDGLRRRIDPGPPTEAAYTDDRSPALPASLADALDALRADDVVRDGIGSEMADVYDTVKRHEIARHAQAADAADWERREYLARH